MCGEVFVCTVTPMGHRSLTRELNLTVYQFSQYLQNGRFKIMNFIYIPYVYHVCYFIIDRV